MFYDLRVCVQLHVCIFLQVQFFKVDFFDLNTHSTVCDLRHNAGSVSDRQVKWVCVCVCAQFSAFSIEVSSLPELQ